MTTGPKPPPAGRVWCTRCGARPGVMRQLGEVLCRLCADSPDGDAAARLFTHFAERFGIKRTEAGEFFDELQQLTEQELLRCGEFVLPGVAKLVVQQREQMWGMECVMFHAAELFGQNGRLFLTESCRSPTPTSPAPV